MAAPASTRLGVASSGPRDHANSGRAPSDLIAEFRAMRPSWPAGDASSADARFRIHREAGRTLRRRIDRDGAVLGSPHRQDEVLAYLDRSINAAAVACLGRRYL